MSMTSLTVPAKGHIGEAIRYVALARSKDKTNLMLSKIYYSPEHKTLVATDTHRMHLVAFDIDLEEGLYDFYKITNEIRLVRSDIQEAYPPFNKIIPQVADYKRFEFEGTKKNKNSIFESFVVASRLFAQVIKQIEEDLTVNFEYLSDSMLDGMMTVYVHPTSAAPILCESVIGEYPTKAVIMPIRM